MFRRGGLMMCGRGMLDPWGTRGEDFESKERVGCRSRWQRRGSGRNHRGKHGYSPYSRPRALSLRPVNLMGNRAPGMRAPRNTNQFLMSEKYQLLKLRSDSVGTEGSGGSDCEMDPLDMDSYLGVLENAHGALLEPQEAGEVDTYCSSSASSPLCPSPQSSWSPFRGSDRVNRGQVRCESLATPSHSPRLLCGGGAILELLGESSEQYYPSENDVIESENFMERDFNEFCSKII